MASPCSSPVPHGRAPAPCLPSARSIFVTVWALFGTCILCGALFGDDAASLSGSHGRSLIAIDATGSDPLLLKLPCAARERHTAVCAHRGNAAELLRGSSAAPTSVVAQMSALWDAGIRCFDVDAIQVASGQLLVGHPGDLAAAMPAARAGKQALTPEQLPHQRLDELRAAGLPSEVAPLLQDVMSHFASLAARSSSPPRQLAAPRQGDPAAEATAGTAAQKRAWQGVPLLNVELKGAAAVSLSAWTQAVKLGQAAGIAESLALFFRQLPGAPSTGQLAGSSAKSLGRALAAEAAAAGADASILPLIQAVRASIGAAAVAGGGAAEGPKAGRPLLGLIVPDLLLQQEPLASLPAEVASHAGRLTDAVLGVAGGMEVAAGSSAAVVAAVDVLAMSIRLPAAVLAHAAASTPVFAWTPDSPEHLHKAAWLGLDVAITNSPVAAARQLNASAC